MQKKKRLGILLILCCIAIGLLAYLNRPAVTEGEKSFSLYVVHGDDTQASFSYTTDAEYLGEALQGEEIIDGEDGPYGLFITTVDGETADDTKQEWWCLTKDGEMVQTGVDSTPISDNDKFELTLTTGY